MKKDNYDFTLGTMNFGKEDWGITELTAFNILDNFIELGYSQLDTSNFYANGNSEIIIGKWMRANKYHDIKICTKVGGEDPFDKNVKGLSKNNILKSVGFSLDRLMVDQIYLIYLHYPDFGVDIDETLVAIKYLLDQGIILNWGISNFPALEIFRLFNKLQELSIKPPLYLQVLVNLIEYNAVNEIIPLAKELGIDVLSWSPLCGGILTTQVFNNNKYSQRFNCNTFWNIYKKSPVLKELKKILIKKESFIEEIALKFLYEKNITPIIGFENSNQLIDIHNKIIDDRNHIDELMIINEIHDKYNIYPYNILNFMGSTSCHRSVKKVY